MASGDRTPIAAAAVERLLTAGLFVVVVLAGNVFIIIAKSVDLSPAVVTSVPIAMMIGYAILISLSRWLRLRDDQAGDNLYYMGFLFTLTSLGVSLFQFSSEGSFEQILRNFGIAIGSTIAGVALRVFFNQMRRDPIETEAAARLELAESARRVRTELDTAVIEINRFVRAASQASRDSFLELERTVGGLSKSLA